ncbi:malate synthase-like isoform X1 [Sardina pilchardus]|uniref:malate synthase-like isoform X1 n=1 Tax=Sardina pilchardus TaxID=27697 RepID=UPI002E0FE0B2
MKSCYWGILRGFFVQTLDKTNKPVKRQVNAKVQHNKRKENTAKMPAATGVELEPPPPGLEPQHRTLFTGDALTFLAELTSAFQCEVDTILKLRTLRKAQLDLTGDLPGFSAATAHIRDDPNWRVSPVPARLQCRHVDIGDLAPCDTDRFLQALRSPAQGIQVDFDDGNCPTYYNQIKGIYNVYQAVHNQFNISDAPAISHAPILMLRPRAWNMVDHSMMVNGKEVPGPLFDFGLLMFHNGSLLFQNQSGPFFYLSKVESYLEARLWNKIFTWTEHKLGLPVGSIKATVLIESVLASFEMEEILYELKEHSAGLNCGIWDYSASFVNKFGQRPEFLLPDRSKYVNMEKRFLRSYMDLLVQTCHRRGALATGGMAALLLPPDNNSALYSTVLHTVTRLKLLEIKAGVDGFMVYDMDLIKPMQKLFQAHTKGENQLNELRSDLKVTPEDLLIMPAGGVTLFGLKHNIAVGILFIEAWLTGRGHFFYKGQVEDSATAEISRSQVWQWIRHQVKLEDDGTMVTRALVQHLVREIMGQLKEAIHCRTVRDEQRLNTAVAMFLEVIQKSDFPEFLTTYLNLDHTFLSSQSLHVDAGGALQSKL